MRRLLRAGAMAGAMAVAAMAATAAPAAATIGAGVNASPIRLARAAQPGVTYVMPSLLVVNTGSQAAIYRVAVRRLSAGAARAVPAEWIQLGRNDLALGPGQSTEIPVRLTLPVDAQRGAYLTNLVASASTGSRSGSVAVGAAAAAKVMFSIAGTGAASSLPQWPCAVAVALVPIVLAVAIRRRFVQA